MEPCFVVNSCLVVADSRLVISLQLGRTPLHLAARNGHTEVLASLVSARAVVDMTDEEGMTPLALAAVKGHTLAAGELIWGHADVNAIVQVLHHSCAWYMYLHLPGVVPNMRSEQQVVDASTSKLVSLDVHVVRIR